MNDMVKIDNDENTGAVVCEIIENKPVSEQTDDFFTEEEKRLSAKGMMYREMMLDDLFEDGAPIKSGDMRVAKEIIESMDKKVVDTATLRAKVKNDETSGAIVDLVRETLEFATRNRIPMKNREISTPDELMPDDVVPGEMEIDPIELELDTFKDREES